MLFFSIFDEPIHLVRKQLNEFNTLMNLELKDIAWNAAIIVDEFNSAMHGLGTLSVRGHFGQLKHGPHSQLPLSRCFCTNSQFL